MVDNQAAVLSRMQVEGHFWAALMRINKLMLRAFVFSLGPVNLSASTLLTYH